MLVLSRKVDEEVIIGENIRLRIVEIRGGKVRLGIDAPREISVVRDDAKKHPEPAVS